MSGMQDFKLLLARTAGIPATTGLDFRTGVLDPRVTFTRASTATFVGSNGLVQTAASGAPRFGYDPAALVPLGLLIEEARTNLVFPSAPDGTWTLFSAGSTAGQADPAGGTGAWLVTADGTSNFHGLRPNLASVAAGTTYALSMFVKPSGGLTRIQLSYAGSAFSTSPYANFSLVGAGSVLAANAPALTPAIQAYAGGWYRLAFSALCDTGAATVAPSILFITGDSDTRFPTNTSTGAAFMWGVQLEAVSTGFPGLTSLIVTTGASAARAADVASMTGTNFSAWYNQAAGTFVARVIPPGNYDQIGHFVHANDGSTVNFHNLSRLNAALNGAGKRWIGGSTVTSVAQAAIVAGADNAGLPATLGYAYAANNFGLAVDGSLIGTDASGTIPTVNQLGIGGFLAGSQVNGHISYLNYYNIRLTNAQLQALTA
jgi:hypothetical protein